MDIAAILVKVAGLVLFAFTARSVYRHFRGKFAKTADASNKKPDQSRTERALNAILLYAWFIFMTAFSLGMVVNN